MGITEMWNKGIEVQVSIVIPVYNNITITKKCIDSIINAKLQASYEIIIANDCSTDDTKNLEQYYDNLKVITTPTNLGFLLNVKNAITYANGTYIFLMNNDMIVKPGFLDYLYNTISTNNEIGLVGAMMLNKNGTIQEAGATVYDDATTEWNYYKYKTINTENIYDVDYCSGCGIMFSKQDWEKLGGFDEIYKPAYYEDVDFCYQVKYILNKRIVCQPKAQIYHLCGKTYKRNAHKNDLGSTNRIKFLEKWGDKLTKKRIFKNTLIENMFSIKNYTDRKHKVITILGIKIKFKRKNILKRGKNAI